MGRLTVLSFGAGQDSTAILYMLIHDAGFRARYAPNDLTVVMSDTGNEHPETNAHRAETETLCAKHGIPFFFLECGGEWHSKSFPSLIGFYRMKSACGSKAFPKTCTDRLKVQPIYRWLNHYVATTYDLPESGGVYRGKRALVEFAERFGKIDLLLGIGADELRRVGNDDGLAKWQRLAIRRVYPLVELEMARSECQAKIRELGYELPVPSNCMICPFLSDIELLWLSRRHPEMYATWVEIESTKLAAHADKGDRNLGVWGRRTLPEVLADAEVKYANMIDADLDDYRMSHGHCVATRY